MIKEKLKRTHLFMGPMSKEIVDYSIDYAYRKKIQVGLIPSRRQIEMDGGYVNDWTTHEFASYIKRRSGNIFLVRDHGGPNQGSQNDDGTESLQTDIENAFDILHIDPWKASTSLSDGIEKSIRLIQMCCKRSNSVLFEVGTEGAIFSYEPSKLTEILSRLQRALGKDFSRISHCVVQSGVKISGTKNVGTYDLESLEQMIKIVHDFGLLAKEHNGDYLSSEEIRERVDRGLDSINIAPEFGVTQTRLLLERFNEEQFTQAVEVCKENKNYEKWIPSHLLMAPPEKLLVEVGAHYCFTQDPFRGMIGFLKQELRETLDCRLNSILACWGAA